MRTIYVVRHGETDWNNNLLIQGTINNPLNNTGIEQAKKLRDFFANITVDHVWSSPLSRAIDTATISLNIDYHDLIINKNFIERDFGFFEGRHVDDYFNKQLHVEHRDTVESDSHLLERVQAGLDEIINTTFNTGVVFCHSHVLKAFLILNDSERFKWNEKLKNCAIIEFKVNADNKLQFVTIH